MMFPIILLNTLKLNFLNSYFIIFPYSRSSFRLLSGFSLLLYIYIIYLFIYDIEITWLLEISRSLHLIINLIFKIIK